MVKKKHKNTVLGYKKGSKTKSENEKIFFDSKLYIKSFINFLEKYIVLGILTRKHFGSVLGPGFFCQFWSF